MKRTLILFLIGLFLVTGLHGEIKFSFKANGGLAYIANSNWNDGVAGRTSFFTDISTSVTGSFPTVHTGLNFGGEFILNFDKNFSIGIGGGYLAMSHDSTITYSGTVLNIDYTASQAWQPKFTVIPILLNLHYTSPIGKTVNFTASVGGGYYMGKMTYASQYNSNLFVIAVEDETFSATKNVLGFQGSVGLEMELSKGIFLTLDMNGRVASLSEMTGDYTLTGTIDGVPLTINETRSLWYVQRKAANHNTYNMVIFSNDQPDEINYSGFAKAKIDLTGFAATLGVRFVF